MTKLTRAEYEELLKSTKPEDKAFLEMAKLRGMIPDLSRGRGAVSEINYRTVLADYIGTATDKEKIEIPLGELMDKKAPMSALTASYWALDTGPSNAAEELGYKCSITFLRATEVGELTPKEANKWKHYFRPLLVLNKMTDADKAERTQKREAKKKKKGGAAERPAVRLSDEAAIKVDDSVKDLNKTETSEE